MRYALLFGFTAVLACSAAAPKPLALQNVALAQYEDGPPLPPSSYFAPTETIFLSFQVSGYRSTGEDEQSIKLNWHVEAKDPAGVPLVEPESGKIAAGLAQEDKNWMPKVRLTILIPGFAPSGVYHLTLSLKDEIANAEVHQDVSFQVRGEDVDPSPSLVIRNCRFYRAEEDKHPLDLPAYRPGDTVWIRFVMVGYKLAEQNRFEVGYGVTVLRPNGEPTFQQPEAAVERDQTFYPRRFLPAALSLTLPRDVPLGPYTVIVTAADKVGEQKAEVRQTFTVER